MFIKKVTGELDGLIRAENLRLNASQFAEEVWGKPGMAWLASQHHFVSIELWEKDGERR